MIPTLRRLDTAIGKVEMAFCMLCMGVIVVATSLGILFRYVLQSPLIWANDASVLALVWTTFIGAAVLLKEGGHVAITGFVTRLPRPWFLAAAFLSTVIIGVSMITVGWYAVLAAQVQWGQEIVALRLPRAFYSIPIVWAAASSSLTAVLLAFGLSTGVAVKES
jgi:TRAP-type C4-dicarboxylate transport system permease small subunit